MEVIKNRCYSTSKLTHNITEKKNVWVKIRALHLGQKPIYSTLMFQITNNEEKKLYTFLHLKGIVFLTG